MRRLFVGRLPRETRAEEVEEVFEAYGRLSRCELKIATDHAFCFVDFERDQDAEDALAGENGRKLNGASMQVEWSRGRGERMIPGGRGGYGGRGFAPRGRGGYGPPPMFNMECYSCGRRGHLARDCRSSGRSSGYRRDRSRSRSRSRSRGRRYSRSRSRSYSPDDHRRRSRTPERRDSRERRSRSRS